MINGQVSNKTLPGILYIEENVALFPHVLSGHARLCTLRTTTDVTHQPFIFGTLHGRTFEKVTIGFDAERLPVGTTHGKQGRARMQTWFLCRTGKAVPGTNFLAAVATIDTLPHPGGCLRRYRTAVFNGEIGQTPTGIKPVRGTECARGTG